MTKSELSEVIAEAMVAASDGRWERLNGQVFDPDSNTLVDPMPIAEAVISALKLGSKVGA